MHKRIYALILLFSFVVFAIGLTAYPHYENDEGIYMSQAWAVLEEQQLSPYTYWYDHAPLGWIVIAGWLFITGGISTFGFSVDSGRIFMLVLHVLSTLLLMLATHRLTEKRIPAYLAGLVFAATPIVIFFGRRVLLDNIMVFFLLAAVALLASKDRSLVATIIAALLFSAAILSKLTAIVFIPALLYLVWTRAESNRVLHTGIWMAIVMLLVATFPIYAMVKGEFVPSDGGEVTFYDAIVFQLTREGGSVLDPASPIRTSLGIWWELDPIFLSLALVVLIFLSVLAIRTRLARASLLLLLFPTLFLFRGGLVFEFYILALAPFVALGFAVVLAHLYRYTRSKRIAIATVILTLVMVFVMAVPLAMTVRGDQNLYTTDQTSVQKQIVFDILENGRPDEAYLVNAYGITEFLDHGFDPNTDAYVEWDVKVETDSEVRERFETYAEGRKLRFVISQAQRVEVYADDYDYLLDRWRRTIRESTTTSGHWEVATFVEHTPEQMLESVYPSIVRDHLDEGRVIVFYDDDATLARYQGLMMLASVRAGDERTFSDVWRATRVLEYPNGALRWRDPTLAYEDPNGVTSDPAASITIARSLLEAYETWGDVRYLNDAHRVLDGIWAEDVNLTDDGMPYLALSNYAIGERTVTTEPAAFDPLAFDLFTRYDAANAWRTLEYTSWHMLERCTTMAGGRLLPEECSIERFDGGISAIGVDRPQELQYGFEASRSLLLLSDAALEGDVRAERYVRSIDVFESDWERRGVIAPRYTHRGIPMGAGESVVYYGPVLAQFSIIDPYKASEVYGKKIVPQYFETDAGAYWEDERNVVTQLWTWHAIDAYDRAIAIEQARHS